MSLLVFSFFLFSFFLFSFCSLFLCLFDIFSIEMHMLQLSTTLHHVCYFSFVVLKWDMDYIHHHQLVDLVNEFFCKNLAHVTIGNLIWQKSEEHRSQMGWTPKEKIAADHCKRKKYSVHYAGLSPLLSK